MTTNSCCKTEQQTSVDAKNLANRRTYSSEVKKWQVWGYMAWR